MIKAKIIADSKSPQGHRLTTFVVTFPRIVLSELNTHRMFSRNSASSRAIPFEKMVKSVEDNPFIPIAFQKDHKGMQGNEYIIDEAQIDSCIKTWLTARDLAVQQAIILNQGCAVTKQLCNRLLEPFMWHTVILTTSEEGLENFFKQRCSQYELKHYKHEDDTHTGRSRKEVIQSIKNKHGEEKTKTWMIENMSDLEWLQLNKGQAEIHISMLAECMWDAYNESTPKQLQVGEWHIPFNDVDANDEQVDKILDSWINDKSSHFPTAWNFENLKIKIATAKCARVSYTVVGDNKEHSYEDDIKLHDRLISMMHWSPLEHICRVMNEDEYYGAIKGLNFDGYFQYRENNEATHIMIETSLKLDDERFGWCNNIRGFIPYRYMVENK